MSDLDHPCKQACSGWKQGYEAGQKSRSPDALCGHDDSTWCDYKCYEATIKALKAQRDQAHAAIARLDGERNGITDTSRSFEHFEKIIQDWQFSWMRDHDYHDRALSVDANMKHDLAERLASAEKVSKGSKEVDNALGKVTPTEMQLGGISFGEDGND